MAVFQSISDPPAVARLTFLGARLNSLHHESKPEPGDIMNADQIPEWLKHQAEDIVKRGRNVREEIAKLSSAVAGKLHQTKDGFLGLSRAVLDGAVAGAQQAVPSQSESVLREVVAGLADGLAISANAVRLTLEESRGRGAQFAHEDLKKVAEDFRGVGDNFTQSVHDATRRIGAQISEQSRSLADHAGHTLNSARPAIEAAIKAACEDPSGLGKEALQAGAAATRHAAGVLFSELGKRLEQAGEHLRKRSE
jgi:hypothetical protein